MATQIATTATGSPVDNKGGLFVPVKILENGVMSITSEAHDCFVNQRFCANLQAYLANYVISVNSMYSVYS